MPVKANKVIYGSAVYYSTKMSKLNKEKLRYRKYDEEAFRIAIESIRYTLNTSNFDIKLSHINLINFLTINV